MNKHSNYTKTPSTKSRFPLPKDAVEIVKEHHSSCQNIGLLLSKYIGWNLERNPLNKEDLYNNVLGIFKNQNQNREVSSYLENYRKRFESTLLSLEQNSWKVERISNLKTGWHMVVGLGSGSVLETSMTLHKIYGFPIIPGSALKGLTKAFANTVKNIPDSDPGITKIFGFQSSEKAKNESQESSRGNVIFFDAIPVKFPKLKIDIMNPHYQEYYSDPSGGTPPADYLSPNPILFLTIDKGVEFYFAVASREANLALKAKTWLVCALKELGIGAKTSSGYGYFV